MKSKLSQSVKNSFFDKNIRIQNSQIMLAEQHINGSNSKSRPLIVHQPLQQIQENPKLSVKEQLSNVEKQIAEDSNAKLKEIKKDTLESMKKRVRKSFESFKASKLNQEKKVDESQLSPLGIITSLLE